MGAGQSVVPLPRSSARCCNTGQQLCAAKSVLTQRCLELPTASCRPRPEPVEGRPHPLHCRGSTSSPLGWRKPRRARRLRPEPACPRTCSEGRRTAAPACPGIDRGSAFDPERRNARGWGQSRERGQQRPHPMHRVRRPLPPPLQNFWLRRRQFVPTLGSLTRAWAHRGQGCDAEPRCRGLRDHGPAAPRPHFLDASMERPSVSGVAAWYATPRSRG